jgi:hypothetical protein
MHLVLDHLILSIYNLMSLNQKTHKDTDNFLVTVKHIR